MWEFLGVDECRACNSSASFCSFTLRLRQKFTSPSFGFELGQKPNLLGQLVLCFPVYFCSSEVQVMHKNGSVLFVATLFEL